MLIIDRHPGKTAEVFVESEDTATGDDPQGTIYPNGCSLLAASGCRTAVVGGGDQPLYRCLILAFTGGLARERRDRLVRVLFRGSGPSLRVFCYRPEEYQPDRPEARPVMSFCLPDLAQLSSNRLHGGAWLCSPPNPPVPPSSRRDLPDCRDRPYPQQYAVLPGIHVGGSTARSRSLPLLLPYFPPLQQPRCHHQESASDRVAGEPAGHLEAGLG